MCWVCALNTKLDQTYATSPDQHLIRTLTHKHAVDLYFLPQPLKNDEQTHMSAAKVVPPCM